MKNNLIYKKKEKIVGTNAPTLLLIDHHDPGKYQL